jgi:hypothetical protein
MTDGSVSRFTRREALAATVSITALAGCSQGGEPTTTETSEPSETTTPSPVTTGLQLWLHPDSGYNMADGSVAEWTDASGNENDMSQSTAERQPTIASGAANGHDAVQFDGEDDYLLREDTLGIANDSARTFAVVSRLSDTQARSPYLMQGRLDSEGSNSNYYGLEANTYNTAGERFGLFLVASAKDTPRRTNTRYNLHILRTGDFTDINTMEQSTTYHINSGEVSFSGTPGGARNQSFDGDSTAVGGFPFTSSGSRMHGEIAEVRVYDREITDSERRQIESRLIDKYDIGQIPETATST